MAVAFSTAVIVVTIAFRYTERSIMGINSELADVKAALSEASAEIVSKIDELEAQIAETETVDPALLTDVKNLAQSLAGIVPNPVAPVEESPVVEDVEVPVGEAPELPTDVAPSDERFATE